MKINKLKKERIINISKILITFTEEEWNYFLRNCDLTLFETYYYKFPEKIRRIIEIFCSDRVIKHFKTKVPFKYSYDYFSLMEEFIQDLIKKRN